MLDGASLEETESTDASTVVDIAQTLDKARSEPFFSPNGSEPDRHILFSDMEPISDSDSYSASQNETDSTIDCSDEIRSEPRSVHFTDINNANITSFMGNVRVRDHGRTRRGRRSKKRKTKKPKTKTVRTASCNCKMIGCFVFSLCLISGTVAALYFGANYPDDDG